jgi:AcrR family transcriptional regulator
MSTGEIAKPADAPATARERLLAVAYELFSRSGIRAVGVDTIIAQAGVAKMTLYRHFPSKHDLVREDFSRKWHILMKGSIVAAGEGDRLAARRARELGELLLVSERRGT